MVTKEQERKALAKIEAILKELGEDSYVATAMAGMVEDARTNIRDDFANSWKDRAEKNYKEWVKAHEENKKLEAKVKELEARAESAEAKVFTIQENITLQKMLRETYNDNKTSKNESEKTILELCETPNREEFKQAVEIRKATTCRMDNAIKFIEKLDAQIRPAQ